MGTSVTLPPPSPPAVRRWGTSLLRSSHATVASSPENAGVHSVPASGCVARVSSVITSIPPAAGEVEAAAPAAAVGDPDAPAPGLASTAYRPCGERPCRVVPAGGGQGAGAPGGRAQGGRP